MQNKNFKKTYITGRKKEIFIISVCVLSVIFIIGLCAYVIKNKSEKYTPPKFDLNAVAGAPSQTNDSFGYVETNYGFSFGVDGAPKYANGKIIINFTNPKTNNIWLMISIKDKDGKIEYGKSGIIKPGEYIDFLKLNIQAQNDICYDIYAFKPETYTSEGFVSLSGIKFKKTNY